MYDEIKETIIDALEGEKEYQIKVNPVYQVLTDEINKINQALQFVKEYDFSPVKLFKSDGTLNYKEFKNIMTPSKMSVLSQSALLQGMKLEIQDLGTSNLKLGWAWRTS